MRGEIRENHSSAYCQPPAKLAIHLSNAAANLRDFRGFLCACASVNVLNCGGPLTNFSRSFDWYQI